MHWFLLLRNDLMRTWTALFIQEFIQFAQLFVLFGMSATECIILS